MMRPEDKTQMLHNLLDKSKQELNALLQISESVRPVCKLARKEDRPPERGEQGARGQSEEQTTGNQGTDLVYRSVRPV